MHHRHDHHLRKGGFLTSPWNILSKFVPKAVLEPRKPFFFDGVNASAPVDAAAAGVEEGHGHGD